MLSGLLLVLFAFSITPKKVLHDLAANHKDTHEKRCADNPIAKITKSGYTCNTEDLVVESPFIQNDLSVEVPGIASQRVIFSEHPGNFYYTNPLFSTLRGPPASV